MWDKPGDVIRFELIPFQELSADVGHAFYGKFENSLTFLVDIVFLSGNGLVAGGFQRPAGLHMQVGPSAPVALQDAIQHAVTVVVGFQEHPAGAVAENNAGGTIAVIHYAAHFVGPYYYYLFEPAALDVHRSAGKGI